MRLKRKWMAIMTISILALGMLTGCGKSNDTDAIESTETISEEKEYLSVNTTIAYSAGDDSNWSYGNQRKEFPGDEACYVRLGSTAISSKSKGVGEEIVITYTFTGAKNCKIAISDGIVEAQETDDENILVFTKITAAAKEKNAAEDFVIFQYTPNGAESVVVEITYDDLVNSKYDERNTVYFEKVAKEQQGIH